MLRLAHDGTEEIEETKEKGRKIEKKEKNISWKEITGSERAKRNERSTWFTIPWKLTAEDI